MATPKHPRDPDLLTRLIHDLILAVRLLFDRRVSGTVKVIPLVMLIYLISPLDLVPDVFLPLGIADDITALIVGLQLFIRSAPKEIVAEYRYGRKTAKALREARRAPGTDDTDDADSPMPLVIDGEYEARDKSE